MWKRCQVSWQSVWSCPRAWEGSPSQPTSAASSQHVYVEGAFVSISTEEEMLPEEVREAARLQLGAAFLTPSPAALLRKGGTVT